VDEGLAGARTGAAEPFPFTPGRESTRKFEGARATRERQVALTRRLLRARFRRIRDNYIRICGRTYRLGGCKKSFAKVARFVNAARTSKNVLYSGEILLWRERLIAAGWRRFSEDLNVDSACVATLESSESLGIGRTDLIILLSHYLLWEYS